MIRRLCFKYRLDTGEKLNANAVLLGLYSSELDGRTWGPSHPVATGDFGNGQKRTPEILCAIVKRFGRPCGDVPKAVLVIERPASRLAANRFEIGK